MFEGPVGKQARDANGRTLKKAHQMLPANYLFAASLVFIVACNLYFGRRNASDRVAMQWGLDGKPNWYAPKQLALWGMVAFVITVRLFIWLAAT